MIEVFTRAYRTAILVLGGALCGLVLANDRGLPLAAGLIAGAVVGVIAYLWVRRW